MADIRRFHALLDAYLDALGVGTARGHPTRRALLEFVEDQAADAESKPAEPVCDCNTSKKYEGQRLAELPFNTRRASDGSIHWWACAIFEGDLGAVAVHRADGDRA